MIENKTICMSYPDTVREYNRLAQVSTRYLNSNEAILIIQSDSNNICDQGRIKYSTVFSTS